MTEPLNTILALGQRGLVDSEAWFPELHQPVTYSGKEHLAFHFALGLAGEAGEVSNLIKKLHRGKPFAEIREDLGKELADVAIYLFDICALLEFDLEDEIESKRAELIERWGDPDEMEHKKPPPPHNHYHREVMALGACPACDHLRDHAKEAFK